MLNALIGGVVFGGIIGVFALIFGIIEGWPPKKAKKK